MPKQFYSASEAAKMLGISLDTLRRWDRAGRIATARDSGNRRIVAATEVRRLRGEDERRQLSARNRLNGTVAEVKVEGLIAQVELVVDEPARLVAIVTADAVDGARPAGRDARHRGREGDLRDGGARMRLAVAALLAAVLTGRRRSPGRRYAGDGLRRRVADRRLPEGRAERALLVRRARTRSPRRSGRARPRTSSPRRTRPCPRRCTRTASARSRSCSRATRSS